MGTWAHRQTRFLDFFKKLRPGRDDSSAGAATANGAVDQPPPLASVPEPAPSLPTQIPGAVTPPVPPANGRRLSDASDGSGDAWRWRFERRWRQEQVRQLGRQKALCNAFSLWNLCARWRLAAAAQATHMSIGRQPDGRVDWSVRLPPFFWSVLP
jgi:hypothetical protein